MQKRTKIMCGAQPPFEEKTKALIGNKKGYVLALGESIKDLKKKMLAIPETTEVLIVTGFPKRWVKLLFVFVGPLTVQKKGYPWKEIEPDVIVMTSSSAEHIKNKYGSISANAHFEFIPAA